MDKISLFTDILPEEREKMQNCFHAAEVIYRTDEIIMEYESSLRKTALILAGQAVLCCSDIDGTEYLIEELNPGNVFGEPFLFPDDTLHYYVRAKSRTTVLFMDYEHILKCCSNSCAFHSRFLSSLIQICAEKSRRQTDRIYILSRTTIQKKLLAYLHTLMLETKSSSVTIPMSYTELAQYLCIDRCAMMRELKHLSDKNIIQKHGRQISLTGAC